MRPGGGKAKGSSFERQVCRDLSLWMSHGERDDLFWRSAMSGGRASVRFKKGGANLTQTGDISAIDPLGDKLTKLFLPECKRYRDLAMIGLYLGLKNGINQHWKETRDAAAKFKKWPLLIAQQNRTPAFVVVDSNGVGFLGLTQHTIAWFQGLDAHVLWYSSFLLHARRP